MRILGAIEFKFDFAGYELTAYFCDSGRLLHIDSDDVDLEQGQMKSAMFTAQSEYEEHLKKQESDAKDWEILKWHLERQFDVR